MTRRSSLMPGLAFALAAATVTSCAPPADGDDSVADLGEVALAAAAVERSLPPKHERVPPATPAPPTAPWRPFSDDSPWNTPIPADAVVDEDSDALVADLALAGQNLHINVERWTIPVYFVDASTPRYPVRAAVGGHGWADGEFDAVFPMPLPLGAAPDPEEDAHIAVIDRKRNVEWGCWYAHFQGGEGRTAGLCAVADLSGSGVRPPAWRATPWSEAHGARACGFPLVAGLIRPEEVAAGHIRHALVVAYSRIRAGWYTSPASTAQERKANAISTRGIPCGGRVQLDPAIDVDALAGASPSAKVVLRALQEYGAYVGDYAGGVTLYADNAPDALAQWHGELALDAGSLYGLVDLASALRVIEIGDVYDNGNGD